MAQLEKNSKKLPRDKENPRESIAFAGVLTFQVLAIVATDKCQCLPLLATAASTADAVNVVLI